MMFKRFPWWLRHTLDMPGWSYLALLLSWDWPAARANGFNMADPLMGGTMSCRMAAPPQWSARGPDIFSVSVALDILP